ncbi:hypothetical protein [Bradyrhizobium sp. HKCCYLR20261]|uniref:hypothetical protein n=1 Tax=Bradyrhizobium sp. HKCCYLR20261 TaxID=3420760 RepID=UPI003EB81471
MSRKAKPADVKPPAPSAPAATANQNAAENAGDVAATVTTDQAGAGKTETVPPTIQLPPGEAAATFAVAPPGWSIEVTTRKGRTQPRYRAGRAFGPEPVRIEVDDLTSEQLQALHDDPELVVGPPKDGSEETGA